jgi:teichuronic acid biosynthesis glycosyltransferase TuaC
MNILVLTNVLPAPILTFNARENDVLIRTAELHESMHKDVQYTFVFILYTSFTDFMDLKAYKHAGRQIEIIAVPTFKWTKKLWPFYVQIAYLRNRSKLRRIVKDNKIDIIHAHNLHADVAIAYELAKDVKLPFLVTIRKIGLLESLGKHIRKFTAKASGLIALGLHEKQIAKTLNNKSHLISHGIDKSFLNQEKQFSNSKILKVVTVSRLLKWKNIDHILYALEQIKEDFTYDIYGDGPYEDTLKEIVAKSSIKDKVTFHGFIDYSKVPETLAKYDLFVLPSYRELFGRVYIEAMGCGLPIISAKTTGMDGYIIEGEHGFLVDHTSVAELKDKIQKFITDPTLKVLMGKKAKAFAKDFSWDMVIEKLDGVYRSAVMKNKPTISIRQTTSDQVA